MGAVRDKAHVTLATSVWLLNPSLRQGRLGDLLHISSHRFGHEGAAAEIADVMLWCSAACRSTVAPSPWLQAKGCCGMMMGRTHCTPRPAHRDGVERCREVFLLLPRAGRKLPVPLLQGQGSGFRVLGV